MPWIMLILLTLTLIWVTLAAIQEIKEEGIRGKCTALEDAFSYFSKDDIWELSVKSCGLYKYDETIQDIVLDTPEDMFLEFKNIVNIKIYANNRSFDKRFLSNFYEHYVYTTTFDNKYIIALCCNQSSRSIQSMQKALFDRDIYEKKHPEVKLLRMLEEIRDNTRK